MKQRNQLFMLIIGMIMSLLALVGMQWHWLSEVSSTKQVQFDQAVAEALRQTNYSLEGMEASRLLTQALDSKKWVKKFDAVAHSPLLYAYDTITTPIVNKKKVATSNSTETTILIYSDSSVNATAPLPIWNAGASTLTEVMLLKKADSLLEKAVDLAPTSASFSYRIEKKTDSLLRAFSQQDSILMKKLDRAPAQRVIIHSDVQNVLPKAEAPIFRLYANQHKKSGPKKEADKIIVRRTVPIDSLLAKVLTDFIAPKQPIESRITEHQFDSILRSNLHQSGIQLPYRYWVSREESGEHKRIFGNNQMPPSGTHLYQTRLFPNDLFHQNEQLMLYFVEEASFLRQGMHALYLLAGLLLLLVAGIFYATFRYLMHHKRLSEVKSDFINNMSHEFKTPLATINLATDALSNDKVKTNQLAIDKYIGIIKSENRRMNQHIELILQTARLERKELRMQFQSLDLRPLLEHARDLMQMQFDEKSGSISLEMHDEVKLKADETHLLNVTTNLLDNALKYCDRTPRVVMGVTSKSDGVAISFRDNGIGMSKEQIDHIFDQFYRVSSGNIHNVKGFGLGLSYAKAIVEAHGGRLEVKSQPGIGSNFIIHLPLTPTENV